MRPALLLLPLLATPAFAAEKVYVRTMTEAQMQAEMDRALEEAVAQFSWAFRGFARPKLQSALHRCQGYRLNREEARLTWHCDDLPRISRAVGESASFTNTKGETYTLSLAREGDVWTADFNDGGNGKRIIYRFEGDRMTVTQEVYSTQLASPMVWTLTYKEQ